MTRLSASRFLRGVVIAVAGLLGIHLITVMLDSRFNFGGYLKEKRRTIFDIFENTDDAAASGCTSPLNNILTLSDPGRSESNAGTSQSVHIGDVTTKADPLEVTNNAFGNNPSPLKDVSESAPVTTTPAITLHIRSSSKTTADYTSSTSPAEETCFRSIYFMCDQERPETANNRTFKIAYIGRPHWQDLSVFNFTRCRLSNCEYRGDTITPDTDVVLVYAVGLSDNFLPPKLLPHQVYALTDWEPPDRVAATFLKNNMSVWNHVFNMTITYRVDSDIPVPYSRLKPNPKPKEERPNYYEMAKQKNRTAMWFVSRCNVPSRRADYVKEMQKYIDVDIYGGCGQRCTIRGGPYCTDNFNQYKFYLSFENSFCTDYITEKLFKNFAPGRYIIPVVRGGGSYDKYFPKGLVINAAHFKTPKALALYLKELGSDPVRYSQQLALKDSYVLGEDTLLQEFGCEVCKSLNERVIQPKTYDMNKWFHEGRCKEASEVTWPDE